MQILQRPAFGSVQLRSRSRRLVARVRADKSIQDLIARDRKTPKVKPELQEEPDLPAPVVKSRDKRRSELVLAQRAGTPAAEDRPKRCKEAIDRGLALFQQRQFEGAIALFNTALELPGNGAYRLPGSPREFSCPSDAEEQAALYNMACAYAQLGQAASALTCVEAVLESGFVDYATLRSDPDLAPVRDAAFSELLGRYDSPIATLKKMLPNSGGKQVMVSDSNNKPPWWSVLW